MSDPEARAAKFEQLLQSKPEPGTFLETNDGNPVRVIVQWRRDAQRGGQKNRVMYCTAKIDDECTGWYLVEEDDRRGLKCLILPRAQEALVEANGGNEDGIEVPGLFVVRRKPDSSALFCEAME